MNNSINAWREGGREGGRESREDLERDTPTAHVSLNLQSAEVGDHDANRKLQRQAGFDAALLFHTQKVMPIL